MRVVAACALALLFLFLAQVDARPKFRYESDDEDDDGGGDDNHDRNFLPESISNLVRSLYTSLVEAAAKAGHRDDSMVRPSRMSYEHCTSKSCRSGYSRRSSLISRLRPSIMRLLSSYVHHRQSFRAPAPPPPPPLPPPPPPPPRLMMPPPPPPPMHQITEVIHESSISHDQQVAQPQQPCLVQQQPVTLTQQQPAQTVVIAPQPAVVAQQPAVVAQQPAVVAQQPAVVAQQPAVVAQQPATAGRTGEVAGVQPVPAQQPAVAPQPQPAVQPQAPATLPATTQPQPAAQLPATPTLDAVTNALLQALPQATAAANVNALLTALGHQQPTVTTTQNIDVSSLLNVFKEQQKRLDELTEVQRAQQEQAQALAQAQIEAQLNSVLQEHQASAQAQAQALTLMQAQTEARALAQALSQMQNTITHQAPSSQSTSSVTFNAPAGGGISGVGRTALPESVGTAPQPTVVNLNPVTVMDIAKLLEGGTKAPIGKQACRTKECFRKVTHITQGHGLSPFLF